MSLTMLKREIKEELDKNPKYREMLFRRGYLLTNAEINGDLYPFYGLWNKADLGAYSIYVQEKQTFYVYKNGDISLCIVGHAYNPFDMTCDENELLKDLFDAYKNNLTAFFDKVSEFTGLHVIIVVDKEKIIACQDACSLTGCYFGKIEDNVYVAEHPQLVADICGLKMDKMVEKLVQSKCYNIGNRHLPGNMTPYKELKRLGANTYLKFDGDFKINRFYPLAPHPEYTTVEEKEKAIKRIGELIHNGIDCASNKWERCTISLSGGTDSKTTLACANGLYDKYSYFSFYSKPQELIDAKGAKEICDKLRLQHTLYKIPENNSDIKDFDFIKKLIMHSTAYFKNLADNELRKYIFLHDLDAYDIELKSWASEVARVFLERKYQVKIPKKLTERHCSIFQTRYFGHPFLLKWSDCEYYRFLREIGLQSPLYNYEHADLFYWEVRMGCWGVSVISSQQLYHRMSMPMNNRKILDLFLCLPREERKTDAVHKAIMKYMNKDVLDAEVEIPNLYFHGYRILMEKMYYLFRTALYRPKK